MVVRVIEGRVRRRPNNALHMRFLDLEVPDPDQPTDFVELGDIAAVAQCGNSGRGTKMKILLGWRNGGPGEHVLTYSDGRVLVTGASLGWLHVALDSRAFQYRSAAKEAVGLAVALGEDLHALTARTDRLETRLLGALAASRAGDWAVPRRSAARFRPSSPTDGC